MQGCRKCLNKSSCELCDYSYFLTTNQICQKCPDEIQGCEQCQQTIGEYQYYYYNYQSTQIQECCSLGYYNSSQFTCSCTYIVNFFCKILKIKECPIGCYQCINSSHCTKCYQGYQQQLFKCCDLTCLTCSDSRDAGCSSCNQTGPYAYYNISFNTCISSCQEGYYTDSYTCYQCDKECLTCTNSSNTSCSSCDQQGLIPYYNSKLNTCTKTCAIGFFLSSYSCLQCNITCYTCIDADGCQSCDQQGLYRYYNQNFNSCRNACDIGYYDNSYTCQPCDQTCHTCQNYTNTSCQSCNQEKSYPYFNLQLNTCTSSCIIGYFAQNYTCLICDQTCNSCTDSLSQNCTSCVQTGLYPYFNSQLNTCTSNCIIGYYTLNYNITDYQCYACDYTCQSCNNGLYCDECNLNSLRILINQYCNCTDGYYDDGQQVCSKCNERCSTCYGSSDNECKSCNETNLRLLNLSNNKCECVPTYFDNNISQSCARCFYSCYLCNGQSFNQCLSCDPKDFRSFIPQNNTCQCQLGYLDQNQSICLQCSLQCRTCDLTYNNCTSCQIVQNRKLVESNCVCLDGYQEPSNGFICKQVQQNSAMQVLQNAPVKSVTLPQCSDPNCQQCQNNDECQNCIYGYYLQENINGLVQQCQICDELCKTCQNTSKNCIQCKYLMINNTCRRCKDNNQSLVGGQCLQVCGDGLIYHSKEECDDGNKINNDGCSSKCIIDNPLIQLQYSIQTSQNQNGLYNGTREVYILFDKEYKNYESLSWTIYIANQSQIMINSSKESKYLVISFVLNQTFFGYNLMVMLNNDSISSSQTLIVPIPNFELLSTQTKQIAQSSTNTTIYIFIGIVATCLVGIFTGGFNLIFDAINIIQNLGYYNFLNIEYPYVFQQIQNYISGYNLNIAFKQSFSYFSGLQNPLSSVDLSIIPIKFVNQNFTGSFLVNLIYTLSSLIFPMVILCLSKIYIKIYNRKLVDLDQNKLKNVFKKIFNLCKEFDDSFYYSGLIKVWTSLSLNFNIYIFLQYVNKESNHINLIGFYIATLILITQFYFLYRIEYKLQKQSKSSMKKKEFKNLMGSLTDGLSDKNNSFRMYYIKLEYNKIFYALIIVFFYYQPILQTIFISLKSVIYLISIRKNPFRFKIDAIKQYTFLFCSLLLELAFMLIAYDSSLKKAMLSIEAKNLMGIFMVIITIICLAVFCLGNILTTLDYYMYIYKRNKLQNKISQEKPNKRGIKQEQQQKNSKHQPTKRSISQIHPARFKKVEKQQVNQK